MGIWPTTWLKFYHQHLALAKENLRNLKVDLREEEGETSLDEDELAQAKRCKEQAHFKVTAWKQVIKLLGTPTGQVI